MMQGMAKDFGGGLAHLALLIVLSLGCLVGTVTAEEPPLGRFVPPLEGTRVLCGEGAVPDVVLDAFLTSRPRGAPQVVVIALDGALRVPAARWQARGAGAVEVVISPPEKLADWLPQVLAAGGVWIEGAGVLDGADGVFQAALRSVAARGGVLGAVGRGLECLADTSGPWPVRAIREGPRPFPCAHVRVLADGATTTAEARVVMAPAVYWTLPPSTAIVAHGGRKVGVLGEGTVDVRLDGTEHEPAMRESLEGTAALGDDGALPYALDLRRWLRLAHGRAFGSSRSAEVGVPHLKSGTLVVSGGGGVSDEAFARFIQAAGGKDAPIVCIPSAQVFGAGRRPRSYGKRRLVALGCTNVSLLHVADPRDAHDDVRRLRQLQHARGVWIDGGRTFRFMDAFGGTRAHEAIRDVLARGGAVGGSSAGCQVVGDLLVRGNPRTNQDILYAGYTRGLGLLPGVVFDAHFLQRGRGEPFAALVQQHPAYLGIGVDEDTSLVIRGSVAEVVGAHAVSFYDARAVEGSPAPVLLRSGDTYELVQRAVLTRRDRSAEEASPSDEPEDADDTEGANEIDLEVVPQLSDVISNALMLGLGKPEEAVGKYLDAWKQKIDDPERFRDMVCKHFEVERKTLDRLIERYRHGD